MIQEEREQERETIDKIPYAITLLIWHGVAGYLLVI